MAAKNTRDKAAKLARKILKLPEDPVPVISTFDWIRDFFNVNLLTAVRSFPRLSLTSPFSLALPGGFLR
jgi:hypothetical protein